MERICDRENRIGNIYQTVKFLLDAGFYDNTRKHRHSDCLLYVLSGWAEYDFGSDSFRVAPGTVFFLARGSQYSIRVGPDYRTIYCDFDFVREAGELQSEVVLAKHTAALLPEFEKLYLADLKKEPGHQSEVRGCLYHIYAVLIRAVREKYLPTSTRRRLEEVVSYLAAHYTDRDLTVPALAARMGVSEPYFRRLFKAVYHESPARFLNGLRLSEAVRLMEYGGLSLTKIAERCGFSSLYYFSYAFKKKYGTSPSGFLENAAPHT